MMGKCSRAITRCHTVIKKQQGRMGTGMVMCGEMLRDNAGKYVHECSIKNVNEHQCSKDLKSSKQFLMSTFFLRRCLELLTTDHCETLVYLTGNRIGDLVILDEIVSFQMDNRSVAYVRGDIVSTTEALIQLGDRGFQLQGTAHSHPGSGPYATTPSGIDYTHHGRLESGGYRALGIIVTRDGYVQFYTQQLAFKVEITGKDGRWIKKNRLFKLDLDFKGEWDSLNNDENNEKRKVSDEIRENKEVAP
jgi:hypothetical protein